MKRRSQRGFTLVEMMLAIALFAMLSITALTVFKSVLRNNEITERKSTQLVQMQRTLTLIERDFILAQVRTPINSKRLPGAPAFAVSGLPEEGEDLQVTLIRSLWPNPGARLPRSSLERVEYQYRQGRLERLSYPGLNSQRIAARRVLLLPDVSRFRLRFYYQGEWRTAWHASSFLPQAIEIVIATPELGEVRRLISLHAAGPL